MTAMKTIFPKQQSANERTWYVVDAEGQTLGRLATLIATTLSGKNRIDYSPHVDNGDYVVVLNADKIATTGTKESKKLYRRHSGYLGGLKEVPLATVREKKPTTMLYNAVSGMLPKNRLRKDMMLRLKLQTGDTHPYDAQQPKPLTLS